MGWKIFAIFYALLGVWATFDANSYSSSLKIFGLAISIPATIGLILFAFNKSFLSDRVWRTFTAVYVAYSVAVTAISVRDLAVEHAESSKSIWIYVAAFAVGFALQFCICLALWRHSSRPRPI